MEEDIKILKELIEIGLEDFTDITITNRQAQAIENLIARYKELEENRKLTARKYMLNAETGELKEIPIDNNYILKSKVQEKIEELEELVKDFEEYWSKDPRKFKKEKCIDYYKLEALQELIED